MKTQFVNESAVEEKNDSFDSVDDLNLMHNIYSKSVVAPSIQ